ncbi:MAG TPA: flagellar FlbD family protein [Armatimonadota bacterium]
MVKLTRLHGEEIVINIDLIESLESTPDTVVSLTTGKKILVRQSVDEVIDAVIAFRRRIVGAQEE